MILSIPEIRQNTVMNEERPRGIRAAWNGLRRPAQVALAVGATAVTAATIAIPIIASAQQRVTTTHTISVAAAAGPVMPVGVEFVKANVNLDGNPHHWLVPADAPWETFPLMQQSEAGCDAGQVEWLREHGINPNTAVQGLMELDLRNDATDGAAMTVTNIRTEGELSGDVTLIWVTCQYVGAGGGPQVVSLDFSGQPAVWAEPSSDGIGEAKPVGSIVSVDLAAGQLEQLFVLLPSEQTAIFRGDIVADVRVGSEESVTELVSDMTAIPKPYAAFSVDAIAGSTSMECRIGEWPDDIDVPCLPADIPGLLASLP